MRRLLFISLAAAITAVCVLAYQLAPRGGRKPDTPVASPTAPSAIRKIPSRPADPVGPSSTPSGADGGNRSTSPSDDASRALGELRTGAAPEAGGGLTITPAQVDALKAQAERRHVRPVTRMAFPVEPGTIVPPQVYLHPTPPELAGLGTASDPLGFIQVGDKFALVGTVSRRIVAVSKG